MSATDSDSSIDWLESDHEEVSETESPQEEDRRDMKQDKQALDRDTQPWDRQATGWCNKPCHSPPQALKRQHSSHSLQDDRQLTPSVSEAEQLFSRKCTELQCYIHPLSLILNGLRSGRYRERLSSFQESVAMDRIQRIMGMLQNPCKGEKYMNIILKMEEMLKSWFPNVRLPEPPPASQTEEPVHSKKAKLCSSTPMGPFTCTEPALGPKALKVTDLTPPGAYSASNMKWLHTSPICSPTAEQSQGLRAPQSPKVRDLTQDSAVSSSTDCSTKTEPTPRCPPPGKINAPCLERLLKSTESIITRRGPGPGGLMDNSSS